MFIFCIYFCFDSMKPFVTENDTYCKFKITDDTSTAFTRYSELKSIHEQLIKTDIVYKAFMVDFDFPSVMQFLPKSISLKTELEQAKLRAPRLQQWFDHAHENKILEKIIRKLPNVFSFKHDFISNCTNLKDSISNCSN